LLDAGFGVLATVTTTDGRAHLFRAMPPELRVEVRGFTAQSLGDFLVQEAIDLVLDATHPFAVRITQIAHAVCTQLHIPYVRYERADWEPPAGTVFADTFVEAAALLPSLGSRIMLTIGARQLKHFAHLHSHLTLFTRILPGPESFQKARDAGFPPERILCLRPPFSRALNKNLFQEYQVDVLVTKASGLQGGVVEKVLAARDLGMQVLMIRRPVQTALSTVSTVVDAVQACWERTRTEVTESPPIQLA
jgi:precorrin-6A/cobalt-precorrin-6A reductase